MYWASSAVRAAGSTPNRSLTASPNLLSISRITAITRLGSHIPTPGPWAIAGVEHFPCSTPCSALSLAQAVDRPTVLHVAIVGWRIPRRSTPSYTRENREFHLVDRGWRRVREGRGHRRDLDPRPGPGADQRRLRSAAGKAPTVSPAPAGPDPRPGRTGVTDRPIQPCRRRC
jgi:hypothetical protein